MTKPNLFILGAPKCGTTAMAQWLASHPEVFVSPVKEPHYFCEDHQLTPTIEAYEALFKDADPARHRWVCEASVWHLFSDSAVPNILRYSPDARFIVMVRNPLEMAPSMHEQHRFNGNELVTHFAEALALNDERMRGDASGLRPGYTPTQHMAYLHSCALGWQVARLFERVPRERIHVVVHDDMNHDASQVYAGVLEFLDLRQVVSPGFGKVNPGKRRKSFLLDALVLRTAKLKQRLGIKARLGMLSRLRRWNVHYHQRQSPEEGSMQTMRASFAEDVERLGTLVGRDLGHWLSPGKR